MMLDCRNPADALRFVRVAAMFYAMAHVVPGLAVWLGAAL